MLFSSNIYPETLLIKILVSLLNGTMLTGSVMRYFQFPVYHHHYHVGNLLAVLCDLVSHAIAHCFFAKNKNKLHAY